MRSVALFACIALSSALAFAQSSGCPEAAAYRFLRFDEDYGYLLRPECRIDAWDRMKVVPIELGDGRYITLGGDVRIRLESGRNLRYATAPPNPTNDIVQRYHVHTDMHLGEDLRAFVELKSNQVSGREVVLPADVDRADLHQGFVDFGGHVRIGRQELAYGAFRRVFPRNGPNVRGSFDGIRLMGKVADWTADAFLVQNVAIDPGKFDDTSLHDQRLGGFYATGHLSGPNNADLYYLWSDRDPALFAQGRERERRHTFGGRVFGRSAEWDWDVEPSLQGGRFGAAPIAAWSVAGEVGRTIAEGAARPRISLRFGVASGDRDPAEGRLETFNSLSPRGGATGETWNFALSNLRHLRAGLDAQLVPGVRLNLGIDGYWRQSLRDAVYAPSAQPQAVAPASRARAVGTAIDAIVTWRATRQLSLNIQAGYFRNGAFSKDAGVRDNQWLTYPYLIFQF